MWTYRISTGEIVDSNNEMCGTGYSGFGNRKNNPTGIAAHNLGPIPIGLYHIEDPKDTDTHGPFVLPLAPSMENQMFGRSGFLIHGDSLAHPGDASEGCVILDRAIREKIAASGDRLLEVIP